jgi:alpha-L-rhamnosidase
MIERINKLIPVLCLLFLLLVNASHGALPSENRLEDFNMERGHNSMNKPFNGDAKWIWTGNRTKQPIENADNQRMAYFRRKFKVADINSHLVIHVSADSRYILWCNGKFVGRGPAKGDITHHFYDSYSLDDLLNIGDNVIATQVVSFAPSWPDYSDGGPPCSIMSATNGFVLDGILYDAAGKVIEKLHSDSKWLVLENTAYRHKSRPECSPIVGLFEDLDGAKYPWGWQDVDFDDSNWPAAAVLTKAVRPDNVGDSFMPYRLIPRIIPFMEESEGRFSRVVRCVGIDLEKSQNLILEDTKLEIPAHSKVTILYDVGQ